MQVTKGEFKGSTGIVSGTKTDRIEFVCLESFQRIEVATTDVVIANDENENIECMWGDLVEFIKNGTSHFGVVLSVTDETASILTLNNAVKKRPLNNIAMLAKVSDPMRSSRDFQIDSGRVDFVEIYDGPFAGLRGVLKHVYQGHAFVHVNTYLMNHGLVACEIQHLDRYQYEARISREMREKWIGETVMFSTGGLSGFVGVVEEMQSNEMAVVQLLAMNKKTNSSVSAFVAVRKNE